MKHGAAFEAALGTGQVRKSVLLDDKRLYVAYHFCRRQSGCFSRCCEFGHAELRTVLPDASGLAMRSRAVSDRC